MLYSEDELEEFKEAHQDRQPEFKENWGIYESLKEIFKKIHQQGRLLMNLADQITALTQEDAELAADFGNLSDYITSLGSKITDLQAQVDALTASGVSSDQTAAIQAALDDMKSTHEKAVALLPAAPAAADTGQTVAEPGNAALPDQAPA